MKLLIVVNPISGGRNKEEFRDDAGSLCKRYGIELEYFHTTGDNDAEKLREKINKYDPDRVVSVGGDGTTLLTCISLKDMDIPFGIVPMGSANGMARELNVPANPINAFNDIIMSEIIIPMDLIRVNQEHYSLHLGDVGINAHMVEKFSQEKNRGWLSYAKHFLDAVKNTAKFNVEMTINGEKIKHEAFAVSLANARMYGTGAIINPKGNPHDGKFEIVVVKQNDLSGIINLGLTSISEKALENLEDYYDIYQVEEVQIQFEEPKLLQLDGELIGKFEKIQANILPSAAKFITTKNNQFLNQKNS
jgi:YegS/Rv2252/BmrU family lipid kinase